jgi:site-specific DNA-methyltransferase (adenine-specific)
MLEPNKIYNMECIAGMKQIEDNSIDLILTDPPFNVNLNYNKYADNIIDDEYSEWCYNWINECYRILKNNNYAIIFTGDKKLFYILKAIYRTGFIYHHLIKWYKPNCQRALPGTVLFNNVECAFVLSKGKPNIKQINRTILYSDTLKYNNTTPNQGGFFHPASRPLQLYKHIILGIGNKGNLILDPFMGSGTTAVACKELQRNFIGFEISKEYCDIANQRLEKWKGQQRLFLQGDE